MRQQLHSSGTRLSRLYALPTTSAAAGHGAAGGARGAASAAAGAGRVRAASGAAADMTGGSSSGGASRCSVCRPLLSSCSAVNDALWSTGQARLWFFLCCWFLSLQRCFDWIVGTLPDLQKALECNWTQGRGRQTASLNEVFQTRLISPPIPTATAAAAEEGCFPGQEHRRCLERPRQQRRPRPVPPALPQWPAPRQWPAAQPRSGPLWAPAAGAPADGTRQSAAAAGRQAAA